MLPVLTLLPTADHTATGKLPEAQAAAHATPPRFRILTVPLDQIVVPEPGVASAEGRHDRRRLDPLVRSIKKTGQLDMPLFVRRLSERRDACYAVLDGLCRASAAREAGLLEVDVIVVDIDDLEALRVAVCKRVTSAGRTRLLPSAWLLWSLWLAELAANSECRQRCVAERVGLRENVMSEALRWARALPEQRILQLAHAAGVAPERIEAISRAHIRALVGAKPEER